MHAYIAIYIFNALKIVVQGRVCASFASKGQGHNTVFWGVLGIGKLIVAGNRICFIILLFQYKVN